MGMLCPVQGRFRCARVAAAAVVVRRPFVVLLVAMVGFAAITPAPVAAQQAATVDAVELNLRADPAFWGSPVGQTWLGQTASVVAGPTPDGWYQIEANGAIGWVHGWYLVVGGALAWSPPPDAAWAAKPDPATGGATAADATAAGLGVGGVSATDGWPGSAEGSVVQQVERWIDVDRTDQTVTLYEGALPVAVYWGAMGMDRSDAGFFATAIGTYYVYEKYEDLSYTIWGQSWVRNWIGFDPNRLNGFHSYSMDWAGRVLDGGAGPTGGCVALDPWAAEQLFAFAQLGTRVEVHW